MINFQSLGLFAISYFIIPRLTFLPPSIHGLLTIFGPFLLPRLLDLFNTARATSRSVPVRPTPPKVQRALNILCLSAVTCLVLSTPYFAPENVFLKTGSRIQIDPNVLFARLKLLRPLTGGDEVLRSRFSSGQSKLAYLTYGPDTLMNCVWCNTADSDDQQNYFLYSLPKIITPHIFHLAILGIATSSLIGSEGSRFRTHATIAGLSLLVAETWFLGTYDTSANKRAGRLQDVDFVHWRIRFLRFLSFALTDSLLGLVLWLTSTNRWLAKPVAIAERLETTTRQAETTMNKMRALSALSNSINRDPTLRGLKDEYWQTEGAYMAAMVQDPEVTEQINKALSNMDMQRIEGQLGQVADGILANIDNLKTSQNMSASGVSEASST